jgi:outer membrane protein OmpA-like peptidoglycan-associated protein
MGPVHPPSEKAVIVQPFDNVLEETSLGGITGTLYNFAIGSYLLRHEHRLWLDRVAIPFLKQNPGRTILLVGLASRSGNAAYNQSLSEQREKAVKDYLLKHGVSKTRFEDEFGMGESLAETMGEADGTEDALFRSVKVFLNFDDASE